MINWEEQNALTALTHLDGRNGSKLTVLRPYFSEIAWMKVRLRVMVSYTAAIANALGVKISSQDKKLLQAIDERFFTKDAKQIVMLEKKVNHDLKALELFYASRLKRSHLFRLIPYINLGIGSEDINSIALALLLKTSRGEVLLPALRAVAIRLATLAANEKNTIMVARTHAQPANITTFGKEVANSLLRLCDEVEILSSHQFSAKCSGEAGSYQAFGGVNTSVDWIRFTDQFIQSFGFIPSHAATQTAPYDNIIRYLQSIYRVNAILIDFSKNMWLYVLLGYLYVKKIDGEVGSAGMPHKVNPIYFEGAEGGLEMANGVIETLVRKLPINRLQRDFSDSTLRRNIVLVYAYSLLSYQSVVEALSRIEVDREAIASDVQKHQEIWLETVKAYGVLHGVTDMYDRLKQETRGRILSSEDLRHLIYSLPLNNTQKHHLVSLCGRSDNPYPGRIVDEAIQRAKNV